MLADSGGLRTTSAASDLEGLVQIAGQNYVAGRPTRRGPLDLASPTLPNSPTLTVAVGLEHLWHLPGGVDLNARAEEKLTTKQYYSPFNYASTTSPGYGIANLYFDVIHANWRVGLWGRNLANKTYFSNMQEWYVAGAYQYSFGPPRTYGIRFEYSTR